MKIQTSVRVEEVFYDEAKEVFKSFGLSFGDAVNIFLAKVSMEKSIPFDLSMPSEELSKRVKNIQNDKNTQIYKTSNELFEDLGIQLLEIKIEKSFKKDIERDKKSGNYSLEDLNLLKDIILKLQKQEELDKKYKRHSLRGNMKAYESIHVKNDWLLIFEVDEFYLTLVMLGKHTQVYKKFK